MEQAKRKLTRKGKVYSLSGPDGVPFYIGCTIHGMDMRLRQHISESGTGWKATPKTLKIRELNFQITATILEIKLVRGYSSYELNKALRAVEDKWIKKFVADGHKLTNKQVINAVPKIVIQETVGAKYHSSHIPKKYKQSLLKSAS